MSLGIELVTVLAMLIGASLLVLGLVVGYWRGMLRAARNPDLDALADVGQAILRAQLNLDALCEIVYQQATRIIDTRNFQLGLIQGEDYAIKVWLRDAERLPPFVFKNGATEGLIGWVRENATGLLVDDFQKEWDTLPARPRYYDENNPARSAIFTPLVAGGTVIGITAAQSHVPRAFTQEDLRRMTVLASQAAGAIHNAQLFETARAQATRLRLIFKVSRQITAVQPLKDLFQQIVSLIQQTFGYYAVNIFTIDQESQKITLGASTSASQDFRNIRLELGQGLVGWAAEHKRNALVRDVSQDERYLWTAGLEATRSEMAVPLISDEQVLGVLDIQSNRLDAFDKEDLFTMNTLAGQLAIAIQESFTYDQERRQSERLNALIEAARAMVSILDTSRLLDEVVELIDDYFGYDRVHLFLREGDHHVVFRAGSGLHTKRWKTESLAYALTDRGFIPWVARHGRPLVSGDIHTDDRYIPGAGLEDTISEMTVPIQMGNHLLGVLDLQSPKPNAFAQEDVALVQALADTVAIALRNARLFANEMRRRILSETLREVSTVLASSLDLESVLKEILLGLERVVQYTAAMILLMDDDQTQYVVSAVHGVDDEESMWGHTIPADDGFQANIEQILNQLAQEVNGQSASAGDLLSKPLSISDQSIGYLSIKRAGPQNFTSEETEIINTFANQAAVAIMNAQLYMAQKEEAWVSTALLQVAEATGQATNPDEVLETVARITPLLAGVEWCAVFLREEQRFHLVEIAGIDDTVAGKIRGYSISIDEWMPLYELVELGRPIILDTDMSPPEDLPIEGQFLQAVLLPLFAKGEVFGMLVIGQRQGDPPLTTRKIELASGIANQAAVAIDRAQLYTAQQEEQWITTVILQVAEAVNSQFDLDNTLEAIVRYTTLLVGVTRSCILEWNPDDECFVGSKAFGLEPEQEDAFKGTVFPLRNSRFFTDLRQGGGIVTVQDDAEHAVPLALRRFYPETEAILGIPLSAQGTLVGAMLVDYVSLEGPGEQRRLNILTGIADQCALAIQTARLQEEALAVRGFEREMELARGIQLSLLPEHPPQIVGWDIAAYYRPARLVGGDFYDFIPLSDGKYAIVVADVADKGVAAAMFMTICRTIIRAVASSKRGPRETLEQVNKLIVQDNRSDLFVTCWYGILDPKTKALAYCSGGHNPPLLIRREGQFYDLRLKGMALGILEAVHLQEDTIDLQDEDVLLIYTDGLSEARRDDMTEFGETELYINAVKCRHCDAESFMNRVVVAVDTFTGNQPVFDDLTLVVLKRDGASGGAEDSAPFAHGDDSSS
ncbi:MAG: GAF domain-containing protein [Chloroflexi bacterium]|nr:GAF domain-containing protein [Chloroflexota bacterium]